MYWPSSPEDGEFIFKHLDEEWVDLDEVLARYPDWRDLHFRRNLPGPKLNARNWRISRVTRKTAGWSLPDLYHSPSYREILKRCLAPVMILTVTAISWAAPRGLVVYENGDFAYSHHATDHSGRLCNAFDLVRLHKFENKMMKQKKIPQLISCPLIWPCSDYCRRLEVKSR